MKRYEGSIVTYRFYGGAKRYPAQLLQGQGLVKLDTNYLKIYKCFLTFEQNIHI